MWSLWPSGSHLSKGTTDPTVSRSLPVSEFCDWTFSGPASQWENQKGCWTHGFAEPPRKLAHFVPCSSEPPCFLPSGWHVNIMIFLFACSVTTESWEALLFENLRGIISLVNRHDLSDRHSGDWRCNKDSHVEEEDPWFLNCTSSKHCPLKSTRSESEWLGP